MTAINSCGKRGRFRFLRPRFFEPLVQGNNFLKGRSEL